jgi:hypothetical protein
MRWALGCMLICGLCLAACTSFGPDVVPSNAVAEQPKLGIGSTWTYQERDGYNGVLKGTFTHRAVSLSPLTVRSERGSSLFAEPGSVLQTLVPPHGEFTFDPPLESLPYPLVPGKSWNQRVIATQLESGKKYVWKVYGKVRTWEKVRVPAGEFVALRVVRDLYLGDHDWFRTETRRTEVDWYVPEVEWIARRFTSEEYRDLRRSRDSFFFDDSLIRGDRTIWELASHRASNVAPTTMLQRSK